MEQTTRLFPLVLGDKILALDVGDQWVGSAISDVTHTIAKPYQTVAAAELKHFLQEVVQAEPIRLIIVGHPRTMKGTASEQTTTVEHFFTELKTAFPSVHWLLWDERLSSKRASSQRTHKIPTRDERKRAHSVAAAYILDSYLTFLKAQLSD